MSTSTEQQDFENFRREALNEYGHAAANPKLRRKGASLRDQALDQALPVWVTDAQRKQFRERLSRFLEQLELKDDCAYYKFWHDWFSDPPENSRKEDPEYLAKRVLWHHLAERAMEKIRKISECFKSRHTDAEGGGKQEQDFFKDFRPGN